MKSAVILGAKNEQENISKVVRGCKKYVDEVIVVDDGSTDETGKQALATGATVLRHIINLGKGAALKTGCEYAIRRGHERLVEMDSDGQHDPKDIPKLLKALNDSDFVLGARPRDRNMPFIKRTWNSLISKTFETLFKLEVSDEQSGFRAFSASTYPLIEWKARDYLVETEMLINVAKHRLSYKEVTIRTIYKRQHGGVPPSYGFKHIGAMLLGKFG